MLNLADLIMGVFLIYAATVIGRLDISQIGAFDQTVAVLLWLVLVAGGALCCIHAVIGFVKTRGS